ncbi:MAG: YggT family protein [Gammaproteobacteria bacterium]
MGSNYLTSPLALIINTIFDLYVLLVLLRFMLQMLRADFYNPVSQFIVRLTSPPLKILRRFIPSLAGQDTSAALLCLAIIYAKFMLLRLLDAGAIHIGGTLAAIDGVGYLGLLIYGFADLISLFLTVFLIAIIIQVIMSWVRPGAYNPVIGLVNTLAAPVLRPVRKIMPAIGGLDLSPLVATLMIIVAKMLIIPPIVYLGSQF